MKPKIKNSLNRITPAQLIVISYFGAILVASLLLMLPISLKPGVKLSFMDSVFTATSAVSVTGLTAVNTAGTFSIFGTFVLLAVIQFGGIGIMTLGTFFYFLFGRSITLTYRRLIAIDQNRHNLSGLVQLMRLVISLTFIIEALGALIFGCYFYFKGYYHSWDQALYHGVFHSISSFTNAGFDIFGRSSMAVYASDYFVQIITMLLIILGAIGFPVLIEFTEYFRRRQQFFRFSLYTKITTTVFVLLLILGAISVYLIEKDLLLADEPWHAKLFYSLFNSVTVRSAGLSTMDVSEFSTPTQFLLSILMFIGASPSSVGGGIRTTTFAVIILTLITYASGKNEVRVFRRSLHQDDIMKSFVVFAMAVILVASSIIAVDTAEQHRFTFISVIFEVCSAFGTTGISMGITGDLSVFSKLVMILIMFIGRIGILTLLFTFRAKRKQLSYHYPKEEVIIG